MNLIGNDTLYRLLFDRNPLPMWVYEVGSFRLLAVNDAAIDGYGYSRDEFLSMTAIDLVPEADWPAFLAFYKRKLTGLFNAGLWRHRKKDQSIIECEIISHDFVFEGREARLLLAIDRTEKIEAEAEIRERELQLRQILSDATDALVVVGEDEHIVFANMAAGELFGTQPEQLIARRFPFPQVLQAKQAEVEIPQQDRSRIVEARMSITKWDRLLAKLVALRDVTERRRAEEQVRLLERAIASTANGIAITDARLPEQPIIFVNPAFERITGYAFDELKGSNWQVLHGDDIDQPELMVLRQARLQQTECEVVVKSYRKDGSMFWNNIVVSPVRNSRSEVTHYVGVFNDITERRRYEAELAHLASRDPVTGLPRYLVVEEFTRAAIGEAGRSGCQVAMLYLDLDRFNAINEGMGHSVGDQALRAVANRLRAVIGEGGSVSRIAGDEFVIVYVSKESDANINELADQIRIMIEQPVAVPPYSVYLTCSIGVSVYPDTARDAEDLLHQAEAAMGRAKRNGRNAVQRFTADQLQELADRLFLGGRLRDAARNGELLLHFQPQVSAHNGQIVGMEALVRWHSPELGFLAPARFIRVAEELGLIVDLGRWVLESACMQAKAWVDQGFSDFTVAVNVSALQLHRPTFVDEVLAALAHADLSANYLELELTESSVMENIERMVETMRALRKIGVRLALDDFGIGYSSLNYLKQFPIEKLKIDQSFVGDVTRDSGDAGISRAIIAMGHQLGMVVMAEGVETMAQMGYLRRNHCDQFQGLLFSGAVPPDQAQELLAKKYLAQEFFATGASERTLLLLDDEENILRALTRLLRRDGYQILTASSAREAFDLLGKQEVHVVLSDQRMPDISGTEFLSQVRALYPNTMRLVLSGYTDLRTVTEAINRGSIYKFLTKPWNDEELRKEIREAFRTLAERAMPEKA